MHRIYQTSFLKSQRFIFKTLPGGEKPQPSSAEKPATKYTYKKGGTPIEKAGDVLFRRAETKTAELEDLLEPKTSEEHLWKLRDKVSFRLNDLYKLARSAFDNNNYQNAIKSIQKAQLISYAFHWRAHDIPDFNDLRIETLQKLGKTDYEAKELPFHFVRIEEKDPLEVQFPRYRAFIDIYEEILPKNQRIDNLLQRIPDYEGEDTERTVSGKMNYIKALMRGALETLRMYEIRTDEKLAESYAEKAKNIYDEKKVGRFEDKVFTLDDFIKLVAESKSKLAERAEYERLDRVFFPTIYADGNKRYYEQTDTAYSLGAFYGKLMIAQEMKRHGQINDEEMTLYSDYIVNSIKLFSQQDWVLRDKVIPADDPDVYFEKRKLRM